MLRILMIAYTTFSRDARVKRHAEALAARGDHVDAICLEEPCPSLADRVSLFGIPTARYRGGSRGRYLGSIRRISGRWSRWCWNFFQLEIPERVKPRIPGMNICGREVKIQGR